MLIIPRQQRVGQSPAYLTVPLRASHATGANPVAHILTHSPHSPMYTQDTPLSKCRGGVSALIHNDPKKFQRSHHHASRWVMDSPILMPQFTDLSTPQQWNEVCLTLSSLHTLFFCSLASWGSVNGANLAVCFRWEQIWRWCPRRNGGIDTKRKHFGFSHYSVHRMPGLKLKLVNMWVAWSGAFSLHNYVMVILYYFVWVLTLCLHQAWQQVNEWMSLNKHIWMCNELL